MTRKIIILLTLTLALLAAKPASAYNALADCRGGVRWNNNDVTWRPSLTAFPQGSGWYNSMEAVRVAWNSYTPGGNYRINYQWDPNNVVTFNDGRNSVTMPDPWNASWGKDDPNDPNEAEPLAVAFMRRSMCYFVGPDANWVEGDIAFNRNYPWETSTNPVVPRWGPYNSTLVGLHEHGHGMGLAHENDFPATMNSIYPNGGPIGNPNYVHPHADDARGDRALYGTAATARDVASHAYRLTVPADPEYPGHTEPIPAPGFVNRNTTVSFQFGVQNRGTNNQSSIPVYFYLSPTRNGVTTSSYFLGSTTLSIDAGRTVTANAWVTIPASAPTGYQYIGWIADPFNAIVETDETNNGVTHASPMYISTNSAPVACLNANPTSGTAPLDVFFDAGCSYDPDGGPLTYTWDYGDGWSETAGSQTYHTYWQGSYYATLTVTDSSGASSSTSVYISATCSSGGVDICPE
jgi:hypothetical protein